MSETAIHRKDPVPYSSEDFVNTDPLIPVVRPSYRRIAGPLPYLLENKLDEERAKKFDIPITFEVLTGYTGTMADVKYQGMFDQADQQDRNALRQLIEWCTLNCYMLLLYQAAE